MKKIAVLTDSAANLTESFVKKHDNLFVVPLKIIIDGKEYRDQEEISAEEVYQKLDHHEVKTSLPILTDIEDRIKTIKEKGFTHVVVVNISSGLSGTFNSFRLALEEEKDLEIVQYDTLTLGAGEGFIVQYALELIEDGCPFDDIKDKLHRLRHEDSLAFYTLNTLKYLRAGGRIGKVEGTLGDLLHIKPIITVDDAGEYVTLSKAFGQKRAMLKMKSILLENFEGDKIDLVIHYGNNEDLAKEWAEKLKPLFDIRNLQLVRLTPVLGVHTGPEIIAYVARRV